MYTVKQHHKIKKCYIYLQDSNIEYDTMIDLIDLFNNDVCFIFDKYILEKEYIQDFLQYLNYKHDNYIIKYSDNNFDLLRNIKSTLLYNLNICLDASFGSSVLKRSNLIDYNYYIDLKTFNDLKLNVLNLKCDIFINKQNINDVYTTVKLLTDIGLYSNLYFVDYKKSSYYTNNCKDLRYKVDKNIYHELTINNILSDNYLKIGNRYDVMKHYSNMNMNCELYKDVNILCLNKNLNICLCPNIDIDTTYNIFECIEDGFLKDNVVEKIKDFYKNYCMCCNYSQL